MMSGAAQKGKHGVDETNSVAEEHGLDQFFKSYQSQPVASTEAPLDQQIISEPSESEQRDINNPVSLTVADFQIPTCKKRKGGGSGAPALHGNEMSYGIQKVKWLPVPTRAQFPPDESTSAGASCSRAILRPHNAQPERPLSVNEIMIQQQLAVLRINY